jgi:uncharacterized protein YdaT
MNNLSKSKKRDHVIKKRAHVIKRENGWAIKKQGASRASRVFQSKEEAVKDAQKLKRSGHDLVIHNRDGSIQRWERSVKRD